MYYQCPICLKITSGGNIRIKPRRPRKHGDCLGNDMDAIVIESGRPEKRIGRPRKDVMEVRTTLRLDLTLDADLIEWFKSIPKGGYPKAITGALRVGRANLTDEEIGLLFDVNGDVAYGFWGSDVGTEHDPRRERNKISNGLRYRVLSRDGFHCVVCGRGAEDGVKLQVDHIGPVSGGGYSNWANLQTLCGECNSGKSDILPDGSRGRDVV